jgi:hypothetical protein
MRLRTANGRFPGGGFEFYGPDRMIGPEELMMHEDFEPLMLERMQPMLERMQPMLEERLRDLPERIELRMAPGVRTFRTLPRSYRVERGTEEQRAAAQQGFIH